MGGCLSHWNNNINGTDDAKQAKDMIISSSSKDDIIMVITENGGLRQYTVPVTVSQVIHSETTNNSNNDWFLCNSDSLYYDEYIQPLNLEDELEGGGDVDHLYFMLPTTKLLYPLTASDMAALAVKATLALQLGSPTTTTTSTHHQTHHQQRHKQQQHNIGSNKARISPFLADDEQHNQLTLKKVSSVNVLRKQKTQISNSHNSSPSYPARGVSKSMRKLQRYSSTRAKMAVRSFRLKLTTIYEGSTHF